MYILGEHCRVLCTVIVIRIKKKGNFHHQFPQALGEGGGRSASSVTAEVLSPEMLITGTPQNAVKTNWLGRLSKESVNKLSEQWMEGIISDLAGRTAMSKQKR